MTDLYDPAADLALLAGDQVGRADSHSVRMVESVNDDGTVNIAFGDDTTIIVPTTRRYSATAQAGDKVILLKSTTVGWVVFDAIIGRPPTDDTIDDI